MEHSPHLQLVRAPNACVGVPVAVVWVDPSAVRDEDSLVLGPEPNVPAWTNSLGMDLRLDLYNRTVTEALLGEPVIVVNESGGWSEVRLPWQPSSLSLDGYPGWIKSSHLLPLFEDSGSERSVVSRSLTVAARADDGMSLELSLGTILPVAATSVGAVRLRHPSGRMITVPADSVDRLVSGGMIEPNELPASYSRHVLKVARMFLGVPYLWAGMAGYGVDCSGLVHLAYRSVGVRLPRDAKDQAMQGVRVDYPSRGSSGDLVFVANESGVHHVGLVSSLGHMLHSPHTGRVAADDPIASCGYQHEHFTFRTVVGPWKCANADS